MFYLNFFRDGGVLFEEQPAGDRSVAVKVDARAARCLAALTEVLQSFEVSYALGQLAVASIHLGERAARGHPCPKGSLASGAAVQQAEPREQHDRHQ